MHCKRKEERKEKEEAKVENQSSRVALKYVIQFNDSRSQKSDSNSNEN